MESTLYYLLKLKGLIKITNSYYPLLFNAQKFTVKKEITTLSNIGSSLVYQSRALTVANSLQVLLHKRYYIKPNKGMICAKYMYVMHTSTVKYKP